MSTIRIISAAICGLIGIVWLAQGTGVIRGSVMTGDVRWAAVGVILLALAAWQLAVLLRSRNLRP